PHAQAGSATLVPDTGASFRAGASEVVDLYRAGRASAQDIGAMVRHLRGIVPRPVVAIGTSRGSLSVANGVAKLRSNSELRPDAAVLPAGFPPVRASAPGPTIS